MQSQSPQSAHGRKKVLHVWAVAPGDHLCTDIFAFRQQRLDVWSNENANCRIV